MICNVYVSEKKEKENSANNKKNLITKTFLDCFIGNKKFQSFKSAVFLFFTAVFFMKAFEK